MQQAKPSLNLDGSRAQALMARIQDAGTEVVNAKVCSLAGCDASSRYVWTLAAADTAGH